MKSVVMIGHLAAEEKLDGRRHQSSEFVKSAFVFKERASWSPAGCECDSDPQHVVSVTLSSLSWLSRQSPLLPLCAVCIQAVYPTVFSVLEVH